MKEKTKKLVKSLRYVQLFLICIFITTNVYAAGDDPLAVVNNLSDFIFSIMKVIGAILTGFGIMQFGLSFKSQDPSQRSNGVLQVIGGLIILFAKPILNLITGG